jgi:hypothetical protein
MKLEELNKLKKRKTKDKNIGDAREAMHLGDMHLASDNPTDAMI